MTSGLAESRWRPVAAAAEWLRRAADLEHWPAFGNSFLALAALLSQLEPDVESVSVLFGHVHQPLVDNVTISADIPAPPFATFWNSATVPDGTHTITAIARDAAGNQTTSTAATGTA